MLQEGTVLHGLGPKTMLFILIVTSVMHCTSPVIQIAHGTKWITFIDVIVRTNIVSEVENIGNILTCVNQCFQNEACVSVFYRQQHQRCQLHDVLFMSPQDGEQEAGTVYYSVATDGCPPTYVHNRILNICYQVQYNLVTYADGVADCNSRGDHYIVIDNVDKQNHMLKQINSSSDGLAKKYHIDGSDNTTEGTWLLHDGRVMTYFAWSPGYPMNSSLKNFLIADPTDDFRWGDKSGNLGKRYICERDIFITCP
ncbi:uncharacterized protein [Haliotis cracherodii]|uniref:uncharacterized protein n=1 Tax=Haliotis cracherodii TaxID=6455 RepID=UPI0039EB9967